MKQESLISNRTLYKSYLIIAVTVISITAGTYGCKRALSNSTQQPQDTSAFAKEDSIQLASSKVSASDFDAEYSAESWYSKFRSNIILFNENYKGKRIDVHGTIKNISTSLVGYSLIKLNTGDQSDGDIICIDVKHDKDAWKDEVLTVAVGDSVHIQGVYSDVSLDQDNLHLISCHIIK